MYKVDGYHVYGEIDNFEEGCDPDRGVDYFAGAVMGSASLGGLLECISANLGLDLDDPGTGWEFDACEEEGRLDISRMECDSDGQPDGTTPTSTELDLWKAGELELWHMTYSFYIVETAERRPNLTALRMAERLTGAMVVAS